MQIPTAIREHKLITGLVLLLVTAILIYVLWAWIALSFSYSKGDRAGLLQKVSQRGWVCKSWEGELQMTALPGAAPEIFHFTTRSDSIAGELQKLLGQRVSLHYEQHSGVPGSCFGDTEYFVVGVKPVGGTP